MLVVKLWNFFRGYVIIRIEGLSLEKFLNYAIARGIYLWDITKLDYTTLEAKVGLRGYKELRHIVKKSGCKVKINMKIGYPFFMLKMRTRKMLMFGFMLSLLLLVLCTSFILEIQIIGNTQISDELIEQSLRKYGLTKGVWKYNIDIQTIENNMLVEIDDLAWVGIEIHGTKVVVEIVEKIKPPDKIPLDMPCDIIAKANGVIEKIIAKNGDTAVQKGDIVKKGDILISGTILRENLETRYVHALGEVWARTYYEKTDEIPLIKTVKVKTGNQYYRRVIKIGESQLILSFGEIPFNNFVIEEKKKTLPQWRKFKIPVEVIVEEFHEVVDVEENIEKEQAKKLLVEKMMVSLSKNMPEDVTILNQDVKFYEENHILKAKIIMETLEQIGAQQKIMNMNF
ncbi:MAG: sporulation protein YqfD [Bacillota bacterium]